MNTPRRKPSRRRRSSKPKSSDLWKPVPPLADPEPITPASDPTTMLDSLGGLHQPGQGAAAEHYVSAVVERAAGLATALAAAAGLLEMPDDN